MAKSKAKKARSKPVNARRQAVREGDATPQTTAKLKRCSLETMRSRGLIGMEEIRAADEIARCWFGICGGLFSKAQNVETIRGSGRGMPAGVAEAYTERYKPWADWASHPSRRPMLDAIISVVVDGQTVTEVDAMIRWREGTAIKCVAEGLRRYAEMAGWAGPMSAAARLKRTVVRGAVSEMMEATREEMRDAAA